MYSQISHTAVLSVDVNHSLPINRFLGIHIAAMLERGTDLNQLPKFSFAYPTNKLLARGIIRELARASDNNFGMFIASV